jgi:hypothetical protein
VTQKFLSYFRLVDACARAGCPVCASLEEDGRRYLEALVYEQVTDPDTRRRLRASWGLCNWHAWMLLEIPTAAGGAAILYEDLVRVALGRFRRLRDRVRPFGALARLCRRLRRPAIVELRRRRSVCPACAWCATAEPAYLSTLTRFVDDPPLAEAYAKSDGLCVPHLLAAMEWEPGTPAIARLLESTLSKWEALRRDLEGFVGKHDYRNRAPFTEAEASSYRRAFDLMAGRRGVWTCDLPGRTPATALRRRRESPGERAAVSRRTLADLKVENAQLLAELAAARSRLGAPPPGGVGVAQ